MAYLNPNMDMPQEYIDTLCEIAVANNVTAEQYAKQIVMDFLEKNHSKGLTNSLNSV